MRSPSTICILLFFGVLLSAPLPLFPETLGNQKKDETKDEKKDEKKAEKKEDNKEKNKSASTIVHVEVTDADSSAPVTGASVLVRVEDDGKEFEPKTDSSGKVRIPGVPRGWVLIQANADHWKIGGGRFKLDQDEQTIRIKLKKEN